jgi:hypothetical protein
MIIKRNLFYVNHFLHHDVNKTLKAQAVNAAKKVNALFSQQYLTVLRGLENSTNEDEKMLYHRLKDIRAKIEVNEEEFATSCLHDYSLDYDEIYDRFVIYRAENQTPMDQQFANENNDQTSVRGVKIRGVYSTREEAKERAEFVNKTIEPFVDAHIGQVGYWLPWDPDPDSIKDVHYQNKELNELMGKYHENVKERNEFYEERKREMVDDANKNTRAETKERLRKKLLARKQERSQRGLVGA